MAVAIRMHLPVPVVKERLVVLVVMERLAMVTAKWGRLAAVMATGA